jgi:hypothetical protein
MPFTRHAGTAGAFAAIAGLALSAALWAPEAKSAEAVSCPTNPLIGTWKLNMKESKVTRHGGHIPDRIVIIAPYGKDGITRVLIDEGDPRLSGREEHYSLQFDGKFYPTKGGDPRLMKWDRVDCNNYETTTRRQLLFNLPDGTVKEYHPEGIEQSGGHWQVSADGMRLLNTHSGVLGDQSSYEDELLVYDRM